jgi:hypothetical protein
MADKSNGFWGGFWLGAIVGGITSALIIAKLNQSDTDESIETLPEEAVSKDDLAKRDLQAKIAQLNAAIDAVSEEIKSREGEQRGKIADQEAKDMLR